MDQIKIGKFIATCRKKANLTQMQLAEKLNITDRAVSKWETGKSMPDSAIMLPLCDILGITVNDLLSGEVVNPASYRRELENNLLDMIKQKEAADKRLLSAEVLIGCTATSIFLFLVLAAAFAPLSTGMRIVFIVLGFSLFLGGCFYALRLEQTAGYYRCSLCGHTYTPTYKAIQTAPHMGRTRRMRCPHCGQKSWQKKVLSKE